MTSPLRWPISSRPPAAISPAKPSAWTETSKRCEETESSKETAMASSNKVIITCAVTGAIHTPSMSPYLPVTADEIAEAAIGAAEAGAAIVHLHARDEKTGRPDQSPEAFARFLPRIKHQGGLNLTTGGAPY